MPDQLYCFVVLGLDRNETASTPPIPSPRVPSLEEEKEAVKVSIPLITDQVSVWKINGVRTGCQWASGLQQTTLSLITCKFINVILSSLSAVDFRNATTGFPAKWSLRNGSSLIPYWWRVTTLVWVLFLMGWILTSVWKRCNYVRQCLPVTVYAPSEASYDCLLLCLFYILLSCFLLRNPLSPNIIIQVIWTDLPTFPKKKKMFQSTCLKLKHSPQVTISLILITFSLDTAVRWTKLFWIDVLLYKNKISQGTLMIFLPFKLY